MLVGGRISKRSGPLCGKSDANKRVPRHDSADLANQIDRGAVQQNYKVEHMSPGPNGKGKGKGKAPPASCAVRTLAESGVDHAMS